MKQLENQYSRTRDIADEDERVEVRKEIKEKIEKATRAIYDTEKLITKESNNQLILQAKINDEAKKTKDKDEKDRLKLAKQDTKDMIALIKEMGRAFSVDAKKGIADFKSELKTLSGEFNALYNVIAEFGLDGRSDEEREFFSIKSILDKAVEEGRISLEQYKNFLDSVKVQIKDKYDKISKDGYDAAEALKAGLTTAFSDLGQAIGDAIVGDGDFGNAMLKLIGGFMQSFGAAIIAIGVSMLELEIGLASLNPALVIGGGIALVAAGAVLSGLASKGPDGKGGSSNSFSAGTATTTTPTSIQGFAESNRLVAEVSAQGLRFVMQAGDDSYTSLN